MNELNRSQLYLERPGGAAYRQVPAGRWRFGRILAGLAAIAGLMTLALIVLPPSRVTPPVVREPAGVLEVAYGSVAVRSVGVKYDPSALPIVLAGQRIFPGTVIDTRATAGRVLPGRAAFRLAGGSAMRLDADTVVQVTSASTLVLEQGAIYVDSLEAAGSDLEVRTAHGVVQGPMSQFEIRLFADPSGEVCLRARARQGTIRVQRGGNIYPAITGEELMIRGDHSPSRGTEPIHGPQWGWVLETAPVPDIEGREVRVFLDWITREGGWQLRFADSQSSELASNAIMHGNVEDLQALEVTTIVLLSSGLEYRIEGDTFLVESIDSGERRRSR